MIQISANDDIKQQLTLLPQGMIRAVSWKGMVGGMKKIPDF